MLIVRDLKCSYGHIQALSGINFKVNQGDIVTLIGNNGAGKSTTLNAICGIAPKISGEVVFRGRRIENFPQIGLLVWESVRFLKEGEYSHF